MPREEQTQITTRKARAKSHEQRLQKLVLIIGTVVILSSVGLVGTGYYITQYRPFHQLAFTVNGQQFDMAYYASAYKYYGTGQNVTELLEQNELIRQAAEKLGFTVSDEDAKTELEKRKQPTTAAFITFIKVELLRNKLMDEYFDEQAPNSTLQRESQIMFLESEAQAKDIKARIAAGEDFAKLAAQYSQDKTTQTASGYMDWHPKDVFGALLGSAVLDDAIFNGQIGAVSDPIADTAKARTTGYWIAKCAGIAEDQVHIMAILAGNEVTANATYARLQAGEDFATVAKDVSQMPGAKTDGGDLGFIKIGDRGAAFDDFAFNPTKPVKEGDLSPIKRDDNVQTRGGYWLVKVLSENKDMTLSKTDRDTLKNKLYFDWVAGLWKDTNNKVESVLTDEMIQWAKDNSKKI